MPGRTVASMSTAAAPAIFVLLWSTGFIGAKYGLPYAEPFTLLALRLVVAAALLGALAVLTRSPAPRTRAQFGRSAVSGVLLHTAYLGGVFWAIDHGVPAGVAAVVVSLQPVLVAALAGVLLGERLAPIQWIGLALGITGVLLVLAPGLSAGGLTIAGVAACLAALAGGTVGTLHQKRYGDGIPLLSGTAVQYAAAGLVLAVAAVSTETMTIRWTGQFVAAFVWLVLVLSLGAVLLLLFLLRRGSASEVSTLFYLVPPATAIEAYLVFGEQLAELSILGIGVATVGVALVLRPPRRRAGRQRQ
ncbi:MAG: DMT family transporter [Geodermatophilaceae bacterium]|nr:DMT family transporter [Geodermatophilaceae bacterium]